MQFYDLIMLAILLGAVAWGAWKGFVWQVASIASLVLSYAVALGFRNPLASIISAAPPWNVFISMLALFLGSSLSVWVGFNFISDVIERVRLKEFDRQLGAMFGFVKGVVLCVIVTLFAVTLLDESRRQQICNSRSGYYISMLLIQSEGFMPAELRTVLAPYFYGTQPQQAGYPNYPQYPAAGYGVDPQGYGPAQNGYNVDPQWTGQQQYNPQYNPQPQYAPNDAYAPNNAYGPSNAYAPNGVPDPRMSNQDYNRSYYYPAAGQDRR